MYYASGAPRGGGNNREDHGQVVLFEHVSEDLENPRLRYQKNWILEGTLSYSGFGSSLLAVDLNNDG